MGLANEAVIADPDADWSDVVSRIGLRGALSGNLTTIPAYFAGLLASVAIVSIAGALSAMLAAIMALLNQLQRSNDDRKNLRLVSWR